VEASLSRVSLPCFVVILCVWCWFVCGDELHYGSKPNELEYVLKGDELEYGSKRKIPASLFPLSSCPWFLFPGMVTDVLTI